MVTGRPLKVRGERAERCRKTARDHHVNVGRERTCSERQAQKPGEPDRNSDPPCRLIARAEPLMRHCFLRLKLLVVQLCPLPMLALRNFSTRVQKSMRFFTRI